MPANNDIYNNYLVKKPWGEEYTIFSNKKIIGVTLVKINPGKSTSLHCHPNKKTGFIILKGRPEVQIGIHEKNYWKSKPLSILVLRPGLFHSLNNPKKSEKSVYALEFEKPLDKKDLIRFKDKYGRKKKGYESKKNLKKLSDDQIIFKNRGTSKIYNIFNRKIIIKSVKKKSEIKYFSNNSVTAILGGKLVDNNNQTALNFGEIIKTSTLKILLKEFTIHKKLLVLNVS